MLSLLDVAKERMCNRDSTISFKFNMQFDGEDFVWYILVPLSCVWQVSYTFETIQLERVHFKLRK